MSISLLIKFWINQNPALSNYVTYVLQNIDSLKRIFHYVGVKIEFNEYSGAIEGGGVFGIGVSVNY